MKYLFFIALFLIISCNKDTATCTDGVKNQDEVDIDCGGVCSACDIEYPETGAYGYNILHGTDTIVVTEENSSMTAIIPQSSTLKIELKLLSGEDWFYASEQNWSVSSFSNSSQTFTNVNPGTCDLELNNADTTNIDTILIKYIENGNNITKQKILIRK